MKVPIVFDLDGTLIDPEISICNSINYALEKLGHGRVSNERLSPYIGKHLIDPFRDITGSQDENYLWKLIHAYRERYESIGIAENTLYPSIRELLADLQAVNYIASIKPWKASKMVLKELGIDHYFAGVYGSEEDGTRANKTELLKYLKEVEGVDAAIMVGDRDTDILAAQVCGFPSIAVTYGFGTVEELKKVSPDYIIGEPGNLKKTIEEIWRS